MTFQLGNKTYTGGTALEIVRQIADDTTEFTRDSIFEFLRWSLQRLGQELPPRQLEISGRLDDETLARNYLVLLDEFGHGQLSGGR
jgi:hypothetical protein